MKLYRGLDEKVWTQRFLNRGWPKLVAEDMAGFLVGRIPSPPYWEDVNPEADMVPVIGTVPYKPETH